MNNRFFTNKRILVTGGTGSIGSEIVKQLITYSPKKIIIFSRDEYKQHILRYTYNDVPFLHYMLGDIRDYESLDYAARDIDILFHAAALKHVPISEEMPEEFIKTNILGSINIKKAAYNNDIPVVVSISTDKAVDPLNVMGLTKAIQEKIIASHKHQNYSDNLRFVNVRFGNVIGTHGSLFPIIYHQVLNKKPITITHKEMTRFFMSKTEATELVLWAAMNGSDGEVVIKKMKSIEIGRLVSLFLQKLKENENDYPIKEIGMRIGEKMHESLITEDELYRTKSSGNFYIISPYSKKAIEQNINPNSLKTELEDLKKFQSQNPVNYFKDTEILKLISTFIKETKIHKQII